MNMVVSKMVQIDDENRSVLLCAYPIDAEKSVGEEEPFRVRTEESQHAIQLGTLLQLHAHPG